VAHDDELAAAGAVGGSRLAGPYADLALEAGGTQGLGERRDRDGHLPRVPVPGPEWDDVAGERAAECMVVVKLGDDCQEFFLGQVGFQHGPEAGYHYQLLALAGDDFGEGPVTRVRRVVEVEDDAGEGAEEGVEGLVVAVLGREAAGKALVVGGGDDGVATKAVDGFGYGAMDADGANHRRATSGNHSGSDGELWVLAIGVGGIPHLMSTSLYFLTISMN